MSTVVNKIFWLPGPWQTEPDRVEWRQAGLPCLMVRNKRMGFWCGYVGIPPTHPHYGKDSDQLENHYKVHGGLTYSAACRGDICHVPQPGESDHVWWIGFDCGHAGDMVPSHIVDLASEGDAYRTLAYVQTATNLLAQQVWNWEKPPSMGEE